MIQVLYGLVRQAAAYLTNREIVPLALDSIGVSSWNYKLIQNGTAYLLTFEHSGRFHPGQEFEIIVTPDQVLGQGTVTGCVTRSGTQTTVIEGHGSTYKEVA